MEYKVVPFNANLKHDGSAEEAATQLQTLIDNQKLNGYEFYRMDNISTNVAGTNGCLGIGAKPGYEASVAIVIFRK